MAKAYIDFVAKRCGKKLLLTAEDKLNASTVRTREMGYTYPLMRKSGCSKSRLKVSRKP